MMIRSFICSLALALSLGSLSSPTMASSADATVTPATAEVVSPHAFVEGMANAAITALTGKGVSRADRVVRFRSILKDNFDVGLIGKWVLGRYWRTASDAEKQEYLKLFEDYIVVTYVERFDQYSGEKLNVVKSVSDPGKDTLVFTELNSPAREQSIKVNWRVRSNADVYKIIDVYVEGISMSQTQRKEFSSVIRSKGGHVSSLNELLRSKVVDLNK